MDNDTKEMFQSKFITFEGTEGVGKSTQIQHLEKYLKSKNIKTLITREPVGTEIGERIRELLLDKNISQFDAITELLLMFAARAQHLEEVIYPALQNNTWVLCDRFTDASYAYQGGGRGVPFSHIKVIENAVHGNFTPDLTIFLNCKLNTGMKRVKSRGSIDRFEKEQQEFFERVQQTYLQLAKQHPNRITVIDANKSVKQVTSAIQKVVKERFPDLIA
ncbi:MAG: dTMP kinase [Gammaproteobacteria bacterium]